MLAGRSAPLHPPQGAHDVAAFVAEAEPGAVAAHAENLLRAAWHRRESGGGGSPLPWVHRRLEQRWGPPALLRLGVTRNYLVAALRRVLGLPPDGGVGGDPAAASDAARRPPARPDGG